MNADRTERLRKLAEAAINDKLGPLDDLPPAVRKRVKEVYRAFVQAYVEIIRMKDGRGRDWLPESIIIDPEVTEDMRHFFSDYQHLTNDFLWTNAKIESIRSIDKEVTPGLYEERVNAVLLRGRAENVMGKLAD
jgi:hypothetical protein